MKNYISILLFCLVSVAYSQEQVIQGIVNTFDSIPLVNAKIQVMSTKEIILTDSSGRFSAKCKKNDKFKISAHGFYTEKVKIAENSKFIIANLTLKPGNKNREYAIGYGHVTDANKLASISNINRNDLNFSKYNTMFDLIQGQLAGVQIQGNEIIIRGTNSMYSSSGALIVLDGLVIDVATLQTIIPGDVKSINVIKDGSASVYGMRGANGVVVIETRRGGE